MAPARDPDPSRIAELEAELHRARGRQERRIEQQLDPSDCALSSWADGITITKLEYALRVERQGGVSTFPALFYLDGRRAPAKVLSTRFGVRWALLDGEGRLTGKFLPRGPARESTLSKRGYREGTEEAPAIATVLGEGRGLSGRAWAAIVRTDGGCPREALANQTPGRTPALPAPAEGFVRECAELDAVSHGSSKDVLLGILQETAERAREVLRGCAAHEPSRADVPEGGGEPDHGILDPSACGCGDGFCGGCEKADVRRDDEHSLLRAVGPGGHAGPER